MRFLCSFHGSHAFSHRFVTAPTNGGWDRLGRPRAHFHGQASEQARLEFTESLQRGAASSAVAQIVRHSLDRPPRGGACWHSSTEENPPIAQTHRPELAGLQTNCLRRVGWREHRYDVRGEPSLEAGWHRHPPQTLAHCGFLPVPQPVALQ